MQYSNIPSKILIPFANSASSTYKNTIPVASQIGITNGKASLTDGFPPLTFQAISAGGVPPFGADFNGILNQITSIQQWQEAGGGWLYDSAFSTTISGYPKGSVLQSNGYDGYWVNRVDNNTTNPDSSGANWVPFSFYGQPTVTVTGGTVTLTNNQAAYNAVTLAGTLTSNATIIVPNWCHQWIFNNATTGSYTVTIRTAAGTGVTVAQGFSTIVYGDTNNVLLANSAAVTSFNTRTGAVTLNSGDVTGALGYTPVNPASANITGGFITLPTAGNLTATQIKAISPNSGTIGAVQIYQATAGGNGNLQFVNSTGVTQWGYLGYNSSGNGTLYAGGGLTLTAAAGPVTITGTGGAGAINLNAGNGIFANSTLAVSGAFSTSSTASIGADMIVFGKGTFYQVDTPTTGALRIREGSGGQKGTLQWASNNGVSEYGYLNCNASNMTLQSYATLSLVATSVTTYCRSFNQNQDAMAASVIPGQATGTNVPFQVRFNSPSYAIGGGWNTTTNQYTTQVAGRYQIDLDLTTARNTTVNGTTNTYMNYNGSAVLTSSQSSPGSGGMNTGFHLCVNLPAGLVIDFVTVGDQGGVTTTSGSLSIYLVG